MRPSTAPAFTKVPRGPLGVHVEAGTASQRPGSSNRLFPFLSKSRPSTSIGQRSSRQRPRTSSASVSRRRKRRPQTSSVSTAGRRRRVSSSKPRAAERPNTVPLPTPVKVNDHSTKRRTFTSKESLVYDEHCVQLANWSIPIDIFDKKDKKSPSSSSRPATAKPTLSGVPAPVGARTKALLHTEVALTSDVLALVTKRTLAQQCLPIYTMAANEKRDPSKYMSLEDTIRVKMAEREKERLKEKGPAFGSGEQKMMDVRTHTNLFRPFIAQEQAWLMKWGASKGDDLRGNCHIFRALDKWEELKEQGRIAYKQKRMERAAQTKARRKRAMMRQSSPKHGGR